MLQELALEEEREHKKTAPAPIVQRAPLQRRTEDLQLAKFVNSRQVISGADALSGQMAGAYYCKVCECSLRDSANYLAHINGKKHNRMLGMSMRAERSTLGEVRARLEAHKEAQDSATELTADEKAQAYLEQFDERMRQREEEARAEAAEAHRLKRQMAREAGAGGSSSADAGGPSDAAGEDDESERLAAEAEMAAAMGFSGFGGSKKQGI